MSLTHRLRWLSRPAAAAAAACAFTAPPGSTPALADQIRSQEWWLAAIHITQAWQVSHGTGVTVAVLDTGVDPAQPDLAGSVIGGPDYTHSGRQPQGAFWGGHGTAMAAIIAGHGHGAGQADGIIGVAPGARILSVRVSLEEADPLRADAAAAAGLPAAIAAGIRYAVRRGAQVIDLPLDPGAAYADGTPGSAAAAGGARAERSAVAYALARGVVLVAPAGDDGPSGRVNYPAAYPGVIAVGAFDSNFIKSPFSSRRPYVTLTAPGEGIITAGPGSGYATADSTSAASAMVAGLAALIRARYPQLAPPQVSQALTEGVRFHPAGGRRTGSGYGTADAVRALAAAAKINSAILATSPVTPATPVVAAPSAASQPAPRSHGALVRDAAIGGAVLLVLAAVAAAIWAALRRRRTRETPPDGPQPTRPLSVRVAAPKAVVAGDTTAWPAPAAQHQRPALGPVPMLGTARPAREARSGPPWEAAPKPDTEPSWGPAEPALPGGGTRALLASGPERNGHRETAPQPGAGPAGSAGAGEDGNGLAGAPTASRGTGPIYVWHPDAPHRAAAADTGGGRAQPGGPGAVPWPGAPPAVGGLDLPRREAEADRMRMRPDAERDDALASGPRLDAQADPMRAMPKGAGVEPGPGLPRREPQTGPLRVWPTALPGDADMFLPVPPARPAPPGSYRPQEELGPPDPSADPARLAEPTGPPPPRTGQARLPRAATAGGDTLPADPVQAPELGHYLSDDEDERHL